MTYERRYPVRRQAVPRRDPRLGRRPARRTDTPASIAGLAILVALAGSVLLVIASLAGGSPRTSLPGAATGSPTNAAGSPATSGGSAAPSASPQETVSPGTPAVVQVPIVPVVRFWATETSITRAELVSALQGRSSRYRDVLVPAPDRARIGASLNTTLAASVRSGTVSQIRSAVRRGALGLLRVSDVTPAVRVLAVDGVALFGTKRAARLDGWPLLVSATGVAPELVDPGRTWTIVAAGDILLDRGVARQVKVLGKGVDFPFDGGSAEITGYRCCSGFGYRVPTYRRTGDSGAVRDLLTSADVAMANLESPVDDEFRYHTSGTVFSGDPKLLDGVQRAGIDFASLGNNHIRDAGTDGVLETIAELRRRGIRYAGADRGVAAARRPAQFETHGVKIAVISCDAIASSYWTTSSSRTGSRSCGRDMETDIRAAKRQANIVIVYPHWGVEYRAQPTTQQRNWAEQWIAAGADLVIGNHAHWAGAVEQIDGKLVFYALGNFVFDQMWREQTMEGLILELTFQGRELKQAWLHPTLIIDQAQPNFMDPADDGRRVIDQVRAASQGLLPY
jgi:hypothetical protein